MSDLALEFDPATLTADLLFDGFSLATDDSLRTAVVISLFTDRRADADDRLPDAGDDRRGWWADTFAEVEGDLIGSRIWLLSREKQLREAVARAEEYAREALQWLVDDAIARSVGVIGSIPRTGWLRLDVEITRPTGGVSRYDFAWRAL